MTPTSTTEDRSLKTTTTRDTDSQSTENESQYETHSLSDSITDYPRYWGRSYHRYREGAYHYPNDEPEKERLETQHNILLEYFNGRLFFSPLMPEDVLRVLDIGTGTGIWPIELAESNLLPKAQITGIDLSPIQPDLVPENVSFEIQDCTDLDWCRPYESLDFVNCRFMAGSLVSYRALIENARQYLKPGTGWLELQEIHPSPVCDDNTMPPDWKLAEWEKNLNFAAKRRLEPSRPIRVASKLRQWMLDAGYVDVQEHIFKIPLGTWPKDPKLKEIGKQFAANWMDGLPGFSYRLFGIDGLGWSRNEIEIQLAEVRSSMAQKGIHAYVKHYVVYGRRPNQEEERRLLEDGWSPPTPTTND